VAQYIDTNRTRAPEVVSFRFGGGARVAEKSEDFVRTDIDRLLAAADWVVRPFPEASPTLHAVCARIRAKMPTIAFMQG